jgi:hypothetical protein
MRSFKTFKPFNRCAPFKPPPFFEVAEDGSPPTRRGGGRRRGLERFKRFERLEPRKFEWLTLM